jgi:hypothetical protein
MILFLQNLQCFESKAPVFPQLIWRKHFKNIRYSLPVVTIEILVLQEQVCLHWSFVFFGEKTSCKKVSDLQLKQGNLLHRNNITT